MRDGRLEKLARVLVDYSVEAREGEQVVVSAETGAEPLVKAVYARLLQVGAVPVMQLQLPGMQELFFEHARDIHYGKLPSIRRFVSEESDAHIGVRAPSNTRELANVDPAKQQALSELNKPLQEIVLGKNRWVVTLFPTPALAQEASMGLEEYEEFAFGAMGLNEGDPVRYW